MLRVGLTGGLGSGKSTAARRFAGLGAHVLYADEIARVLMQPGQNVYTSIVKRFGPEVVADDGTLKRAELARMAFAEGRIGELEAIVHPATIARQAELIAEIEARDPDAVVVIESALLFETKHGGDGWHKRFDRIVFVQAPEVTRIARFVARAGSGRPVSDAEREALEADARRRMANQSQTERNAAQCDFVLTNDGTVNALQIQVDALWPTLREAARAR